jgi:hypothetical protein
MAISIRDRNDPIQTNPYDDMGGWLNYVYGEGGPPQANLGDIGGAMELFGPSVYGKYGLQDLSSGLSYDEWARQGANAGLGYQLGERGTNERGDSGDWLYLTQNGQRTGDRALQIDTPYDFVKEALLPGAALLGGGYLLAGLGGAGAAAGGASGAGSAGAAGTSTLGASLTPTAVAPFTAAPISAALPTVAELGFGALGAGAGAAGLGALMTPTSVPPFVADPISASLPSVPSIGGAGGLAGFGNALGKLGSLGNAATAIGGVLGAVEGGKGQSATQENRLDPRIAQYLFGTGYGDQNSLLGAAQKQWQQNPTGLNPLQTQALEMQKNYLQSPEYTQGFQQMRNVAQGLLSNQAASNPFTSGQIGLLSKTADYNPASLYAGRGLLR